MNTPNEIICGLKIFSKEGVSESSKEMVRVALQEAVPATSAKGITFEASIPETFNALATSILRSQTPCVPAFLVENYDGLTEAYKAFRVAASPLPPLVLDFSPQTDGGSWLDFNGALRYVARASDKNAFKKTLTETYQTRYLPERLARKEPIIKDLKIGAANIIYMHDQHWLKGEKNEILKKVSPEEAVFLAFLKANEGIFLSYDTLLATFLFDTASFPSSKRKLTMLASEAIKKLQEVSESTAACVDNVYCKGYVLYPEPKPVITPRNFLDAKAPQALPVLR